MTRVWWHERQKEKEECEITFQSTSFIIYAIKQFYIQVELRYNSALINTTEKIPHTVVFCAQFQFDFLKDQQQICYHDHPMLKHFSFTLVNTRGRHVDFFIFTGEIGQKNI